MLQQIIIAVILAFALSSIALGQKPPPFEMKHEDIIDRDLEQLEKEVGSLERKWVVKFVKNLPSKVHPESFDETKKANLTNVTREILAKLPEASVGDRVQMKRLLCYRPISSFVSLTADEQIQLTKACKG